MQNSFVHFRAQSSYSMLESAIKIDKLIELCKKHGMKSICLADRGNLFASLEFAIAASKAGIQPIHGAILKLKYGDAKENSFTDIVLIAKDQQGYQNLLKLVSYSFTKNDCSICNHITFEDLVNYNEGIIALSGYLEGIVGKLLLDNKAEEAKEYTKKLNDLFADRFYFEISRHSLSNEQKIEHDYIKIAEDFKIPLLATNHALFPSSELHDAHDILTCISAGVVQEEENRIKVSNQCYFKSQQEMIELFADIPEAIENTTHLAKRCYVMSEVRPPSLPRFATEDISEEEMLSNHANAGLDKRLQKKFKNENIKKDEQEQLQKEYKERLDYELGIICSMEFAGYFLIVSDFIKWSKNNEIAVGPGRGSGAGSIIAWVLEITDLDPISFGLLFERFLNPERVSMPDFDIDFCQERREEVINYVRQKYGDDRVGQIITFGKLQAKAVIKDVSRVLGLSYRGADCLTELVPFNAVNPVTLRQAIDDVKELRNAYTGNGLYNYEGDEQLIKHVLETSLSLEGLHRHASTHAAGIVISNQDMIQLVPVYNDGSSEMLIVQYSMKYSELAGLVKFDFLGLQTLTVITKTLKLLEKRKIFIDIETIPLEDKKTFDMLSNGMGTGVFQLESVGMKNALRKLKPDNVHDIIALGALYRPGPMDNIPTFIACKHGKQEADYLHPILEPILKTTYGVIIYQEQVMEIAQKLSGYSLGAADLLRRAMGKKVKAEMDAQEEIFVGGAVKNKISSSQAKSIFATVAKFAGYGFNKSHASAYGMISYQTAYLKANYTVEFLVASLNLDMDNSDKISVFLQEAKDFDISILPPDINSSDGHFKIIDDTPERSILYAMGAIKGVTIIFGNAIKQEREKNGEFKSISDFAERIPPKQLNRRQLENLIKAGAFDSLHENRKELLLSINSIIKYCQSYHEEKSSLQFSLISVDTGRKDILAKAKELPYEEKANAEFEVFGLFINNNPLNLISSELEKSGVVTSTYVNKKMLDGSHIVKLAGVITKKASRMSSKGKFVTLHLADQDGIFEVTIFNEELFKTHAAILNVKNSVIVYADIYKDNGGVRITASKFSSVDDLLEKNVYNLKLKIKNSDEVKKIIDLLKDSKKDNNPDSTIKKDKKPNSTIEFLIPVDNKFVSKITLAKKHYIDQNTMKILNEFV